MKKILSVLLTIVMLVGMLPICSVATDVNLSATCTNYTVSFAVSGATVKSGTATSNGNSGTLDIVVTNVTGALTITPTFRNTSVQIVGTSPSPVTVDVSSGSVTTNFAVMALVGGRPQPGGTWTVNVAVASADDGDESTLSMTTDLSESEVKYVVGKTVSSLEVCAEHSEGEEISYQWYSSATKSADDGTIIDGATSTSYTPSADTVGTTYYYVVASCGELTITSKIAKITVEAPTINFITNLSESEVEYAQGKEATTLTVIAEYTGVTENTVTYQWYSNTDKNTEGATLIEGATEDKYTPLTDSLGTTYYHVVATCEGISSTSSIAKITVVAPELKFTSNLSENEVKYKEGFAANALSVSTEYTGITQDTVTYQWYSYTDSIENAVAITDAISANYTPSTDAIGTKYYYVLATHRDLTIASKIAKVTVEGLPALTVTDNVIDITDKTVYSLSSFYAKAVNIKIDGAIVEKATEDGTTVNIVLDGTTEPEAEIFVEFGTSLYKCTMSGQTGSVILENGKAQLVMTLKGTYGSNWNGTASYTLNFSLGKPPTTPPTRKVETDEASTYNGVAVNFNLNDYFSGAKNYYIVENGQKIPLENNIYSFRTYEGGVHTLIFVASNDNGDCPDFVIVTVNVTKIASGSWLGITTSKGSVNNVIFADSNGEPIEGLTAYLEGTAIFVTLPRSYGINEKITATFDLTQTDGLPKLSTSDDYRRINDTKIYNTTLSNGKGSATMYLYNINPGATNNSNTKYTINYAVANEIPVLSDNQETTATAEIVAGNAYMVDLLPIFTDADGDELTYSVKVNGEAAISTNANYSFIPTLGGTYELEFFASDFMATSVESYKVTLTVANSTETYNMAVLLPDDITPSFYITNGYDENGKEILGDALTFVSGENSDGYITYTVSVPLNISLISVRDDVYGGMSIPALDESTIKLCKVQTKILDFGDKEISGGVDVTYNTHKAEGINGKFLLVPQEEYSFTAYPENTSIYNKSTENIVLSEDANTVNIKASYKNPKMIITTTGATARIFKYESNYWIHKVYESLATVDNEDGTSTHYFAVDGNISYRVSMDGKITKAGYLLSGNSARVVYSESDALPTDRVDYSVAGTDASIVADDSLLLNINQQNHLSLSVGQTKTLKAYRAWEIINNYLNNIIQPNFNFKIISGDEVVSLAPYENQPMTNGSGNWRTLTAIGEGTAVIEVTYDAIQISGGSYGGFYGATDSARTGLFVITVGGNVPDVDFGIVSKTSAGSIVYNEANAKPWDSEFDTLYFFGDNGEIKLSPTFEDGNITEVAVSADKGQNYTVIELTEGVYTAPIVAGNNIIRVTTDKGIAYKIVRGDKVELSVKNITNPGKPIAAGDKVTLKLEGVHTPIPKISGTFNPGYTANTDGESKAHIRYSFGDESVASVGVQYDFSLNGTTMEFTVPSDSEETEFTLTDGYIGVGVIGVTGFSDDGDSHRNIPDSGGGTRDSKTTFTTRSLLPDITVSIGMLPSDNTAPFIRENAPKTATLNLGGTYALSMSKVFTDRDSDTLTYTAKVGDGQIATIDDAYYTFTPDAIGTYTIEFIANDGKVDSDAHTVTLTVKEKSNTSSSTPSNEYDITGDEIDGYVTVSFTDNGKRVAGESNVTYPKALGTIISSKRVPFKDGDTVADVTLRLLDAQGFSYQHTGTTKNGFYLASIGDFTLKGIDYVSFGEFDAGVGSGWMITLNSEFIEYGASEFEVENGDVIKWQYTCQLGEDIGDPFYSGSSSSSSIKLNKTEVEKKEENDKQDEESKEEPKEEIAKNTFTETTFADVKKEDWHYESVKYVYENNLMQGTENGFEPESKMTRAMLVTVLYRMTNHEDAENTHGFSDVLADQWYSDAIAWAASNGIVSGITNTEFAPDSDVSREQMALIIYRYAKMQGMDVSGKADISGFVDTNDVSDWALDAIKWANKAELVNGTSKTTLSPKDTATRAQVATILKRFYENVAK